MTSSAADCLVVIPCYNEERAIGTVVERVRCYVPEVWVIDDGSTDRTAEQAAKAGAKVIQHPQNLGKGAALRRGLGLAGSAGYRWGITMDGDGQHAADDLPQFLEQAQRGGYELVVGNRMINSHAMPWLRRQVNLWMSRRLSHAAQRPFPDSQCGFRLINLQAWTKLQLLTDRFEIESEVLLSFHRAGHRIGFVPVQVIYRNERSKIRPWQDSRRWFRWFARATRL